MNNYKNPSSLQEIKQYRPAQLRETTKDWYIEYYSFNPESKKLQRLRIRVNRIEKKSERRAYAYELVKRLNAQLKSGWNPFIDPEKSKTYHKVSEVISLFLNINQKNMDRDLIRLQTYRDYCSYLGIFSQWLDKKYPNLYVYKLEKVVVSDFMDYLLTERKITRTRISDDKKAKKGGGDYLSKQTVNNYLNVLRVFAGWMVQKDYAKTRFTDGIEALRKDEKQRTVIEPKDREKIKDLCMKKKPAFWLACMVQYYCFIRPIEMTRLKLSDISFKDQVIRLSGDQTKNRKSATVTVPAVLINLMIENNIQSYPSNYFLFSTVDFRPGATQMTEKRFRVFWLRIRRELKLPESYKFYSFKDTGITDMMHNTNDVLTVRNQARHSDISITNLYMSKIQKANENLKNLDYEF